MDTGYAHINGARLAYTVLGPTDGPPIVGLPSLFMDRTMLVPLALGLAHHGHRVWLLDHRGQGESERAPRPELSIVKLAADVAEFIRTEVSAPVDLVGSSQGGMVGLQLLADHSRWLTSLVTLGSTADTEARIAEFEPLVEHLSRHGGQDLVDHPQHGPTPMIGILSDLMFGDWSLAHNITHIEPWIHRFASLDPRIGDAAHQVIHRPALPDDLHERNVPVLAVAGETDHAYPSEISAIGLAARVRGEAVVIERAGHSVAFEQPDLVLPHLLRHLDTVRSTGRVTS